MFAVVARSFLSQVDYIPTTTTLETGSFYQQQNESFMSEDYFALFVIAVFLVKE